MGVGGVGGGGMHVKIVACMCLFFLATTSWWLILGLVAKIVACQNCVVHVLVSCMWCAYRIVYVLANHFSFEKQFKNSVITL